MFEVSVYNRDGYGDVEAAFDTKAEAMLFAEQLVEWLPESAHSIVVYYNNETVYEIIL